MHILAFTILQNNLALRVFELLRSPLDKAGTDSRLNHEQVQGYVVCRLLYFNQSILYYVGDIFEYAD